MNAIEYTLNGRRYRMTSDLHTHTIFSHGKGTIEQNVIVARDRGIRTIGISDHGFSHVAFGLTRKKLQVVKGEIMRLRERYPDMEILLGIEANVVSGLRGIDMKPADFADFDYVIAGYHYGAAGWNVVQSTILMARNIIEDKTGITSKRLLRTNTDNMVRAIEQNPLKFITHPWDKTAIDLLEIAVVCARRGTLIEINTGHLSNLTVRDLQTMAMTDVKFILTSDAHTPSRIGDFAAGLTLAVNAGLDVGRIVNIEMS